MKPSENAWQKLDDPAALASNDNGVIWCNFAKLEPGSIFGVVLLHELT
jgi:hypothetical protein